LQFSVTAFINLCFCVIILYRNKKCPELFPPDKSIEWNTPGVENFTMRKSVIVILTILIISCLSHDKKGDDALLVISKNEWGKKKLI
jgi:hypothetical protein